MNEIKTVFGFTVRSAVRKKPFKVTTIVLLALILILCALPSLLSSDAETPPEETPADEKSYACYYIDPKGLIPGGRETLAALLPNAEVLDGDIARLDEYGLECDDNGATLVVEVVEREGAPFIQLYQGALSNPAMNKAFLAGMVMQLSVLLLPPLQGVFSVCPMDLTQWVTVLALAMAPIPICEAEKALRRRRPEAEEPRQEKELSAARK